jgi:GNAT superfamily N-acetyltransferase
MSMTMDVKLVESDAQRDMISGVRVQLRSRFDKDGLMAQMREQQKGGYQLAYVESDGTVLGVAGFVVSTKLAWGKHIYIDDFVTGEHSRRSGAGGRLMDWFKSYARERGCKQIHVDSGVQNFTAHRFYLRQGFNIASHHCSMKDLSE